MQGNASDAIRAAVHEHLAWWGLRRFTSDADYFAWQRQQLPPSDLNRLNAQVERRREGDRRDEIAFYDLTAQPKILRVLYSQRYDYYEAIAPRVAARMGDAKTILDFGCGVGILTTFYARRFPDRTFVGVDRSQASLAVAQQKAKELNLANVTFVCMDVETESFTGSYDLVVATHALVQAEQELGIPSRSWQTFERARDARQQTAFEQRTGVGIRLDRLTGAMQFGGRMILFEKTRPLARLVPFQRALAAREFALVEPPELVRYRLVEETADDGPLFLLRRKTSTLAPDWNESPEPDEGAAVDRAARAATPDDPDAPLYENHWPSAQQAWEQLKDRTVIKETTRQEPDGRELHVELGAAEGCSYLYCANTFDRRQLVMVESNRVASLDTYYQEILGG